MELLVALLTVSPQLAAEVIGILHEQGHVTAQEVADFLVANNKTGMSFFPSLKPKNPSS